MLRWYADNSELNGIWNAQIPDILMLGGIAVPSTAELALKNALEEVKLGFSDTPNYPLKWNLKNLKPWFEASDQTNLYKQLLSDSKSWRTEIFQRISCLDCTILVCMRGIFGTSRQEISRLKNSVVQMTFADALARFGLLVQASSSETAEVILDWPESANHAPYTETYSSALLDEQGFYCGPLKSLGFSDAPLFTRMEDSSLMQLSDLVVGASREFVEYGLGKRENRPIGFDVLRMAAEKIRGWPDQILERGICVPKGPLRDRIGEMMQEFTGIDSPPTLTQD